MRLVIWHSACFDYLESQFSLFVDHLEQGQGNLISVIHVSCLDFCLLQFY